MYIIDNSKEAKRILGLLLGTEVKSVELALCMTEDFVFFPIWRVAQKLSARRFIYAIGECNNLVLGKAFSTIKVLSKDDVFMAGDNFYKASQNAEELSFARMHVLASQKDAHSLFSSFFGDGLKITEIIPLKFEIGKSRKIYQNANQMPLWYYSASLGVFLQPVELSLRRVSIDIEKASFVHIGESFLIKDSFYTLGTKSISQAETIFSFDKAHQ